MTAPQTGHFPFTALRPFFIVSSTASAMGRFALHRTQYPSAIKTSKAGPEGPAVKSLQGTGRPAGVSIVPGLSELFGDPIRAHLSD